jgi:hypothetical protein
MMSDADATTREKGAYHVLLYPGAGHQTEAAMGVTVLHRMLAAGRPNFDRRRRVIK